MPRAVSLAVLAILSAGPAWGVSLTLVSEESPYPGLVHRQYRTASPATDTWVTLVDLCADRVEVAATRPTTTRESTASWAAGTGVQLATNGDFYRTAPVLRVYGDAVGGGVSWPLDQTGVDPQYDDEWYYERYGWIAFGPDGVEFTHTGWVKDHAAEFGGLDQGWRNDTNRPPPPPGTLALVSGFPELIIEGQPITCVSATDSGCFPDRTDMRSRHPRSMMGLSEDRGTFFLVAVDGRTGTSSGMYGLELVDVMQQLGAWTAFNLDGGGSSQMWLEDRGYANGASGNNGGGFRAVTNHWGVFAGSAGGRPLRPAHCAAAEPCAVLPPEGGVLEETGACFRRFGPEQYWRDESVGHDGGLLWTNAFQAEFKSNWAWWQIHPSEAGEYLVEVYAEPQFSVYGAAAYTVRAAGEDAEVVVDLGAADGWTELGAFEFDAGADQWVSIRDNAAGAVGADQHVPADAIRLTRLDLPEGDDDDAGDDDDDDASDDDDAGDDDDVAEPGPAPTLAGTRVASPPEGPGCACSSAATVDPRVGLLVLLPLRRRWRRPMARATNRRALPPPETPWVTKQKTSFGTSTRRSRSKLSP